MLEHSYENILVALDGSKLSKLAFERSMAMAKRQNATLHLVHIVDTSPYPGASLYDMNFIDNAMEDGKVFIENFKHKAENFGVEKINTIVEHGSPKRAITNKAAKEAQADLIICGATGLYAVERFFLGGVSSYIVRNATCDVLVIRNQEQAETK